MLARVKKIDLEICDLIGQCHAGTAWSMKS